MIQFPQNPNLNQVFTISGSSWIWNGQSWSYVENNPELKRLAFFDSLSTDDIIGLRSELDAKQRVGNYSLSGHTHTASQISDSTAAGRILLTGSNALAQRTSLGLGTIATLASGLFYPASNPSGYTVSGHGHQISDISSLRDILNSAAYITGDQSLSGIKNFYSRPTINGTGILLSGEAAKLPTTLLYSTGDQNISGIFTSYLKDGQVKIELGLSNYVQVANNESFPITKGQVVYLIGGGNDEIASVKLACSTGDATSSNTIGILSHNLMPGETGYAINRGLITGISLNSFNNGDRIYLGPVHGSITNQKLLPPSHLVSLGFVEKAGTGQDQGIAYIKIEDGYQLDDLHDVMVAGAVSGSLLVNDGPLWRSKSPLDLKLIKNDNGCSSVRTLTQAEYDGLPYPEPYADTLYIISDVQGSQFTGVLSVAGKQGIVTLNASDVNGLGTAATLPSGFFYPASNPSGFITGAIDAALFYPRSNPSGYITGNLSNYSLTGHTHTVSQISDASAAGRLLLTGTDATSQRASLGLGTIATLASGLFYPASNPSGYITGNLSNYSLTGHTHAASQISDASAAGRLLLTGTDATSQRASLGLGTIATLASGLFYPASNPSGFITGNLSMSSYSLTGHTHIASQISDSSAAGILLLTGTDAASQRTSLGLGTIATLASGLFYPASNPSGFITLSSTNPNTVNITGDQNISGIKNFYSRPTVNGVSVLLSGEVQNNTVISGLLYSSQVNVKNNNGSTIYKGQPVYISGAAGANILVALASNASEGKSSKTLGLIFQDSLLQNASGTVITDGILQKIDTSLASAEGDPIWLGPTGNLIYGLANKPVAPNHLVYLGVVMRKHAINGEIFVKVQNGYELDELHNVNVTGSVSGDFLFNDGNIWRGITPSISNVSGLSAELSNKVINSNGCSSIRTLTQAEYNGLVSPEPYSDTLYIISDGNGYAAESYKNIPSISNGQLNLNLTQSKFFYVNLNQNITGFNLNSLIASGAVTSFDLQLESDGNGRTVTWFSGVRWNNSTPPTLSTNAGKVDTFSFMTHDAGQRWFASIKGQNQ
jgi:hypothetical protein